MATSHDEHASKLVAHIKAFVPKEVKPPPAKVDFANRPPILASPNKRTPINRASGGGGSDGGGGSGGSGGGGSGDSSGGESHSESHTNNSGGGGSGMSDTNTGSTGNGGDFSWRLLLGAIAIIGGVVLGWRDVPERRAANDALARTVDLEKEKTKQRQVEVEIAKVNQKAVQSSAPLVPATIPATIPANNKSSGQSEGFNIVIRNGEQVILPPKSTITLVSANGSAMSAKIILPHRIDTYSGQFRALRLDSEGGESWTEGYQQGDPLQSIDEVLEGSYQASTTSVKNGWGGLFLQIFVPPGGKVILTTKE